MQQHHSIWTELIWDSAHWKIAIDVHLSKEFATDCQTFVTRMARIQGTAPSVGILARLIRAVLIAKYHELQLEERAKRCLGEWCLDLYELLGSFTSGTCNSQCGSL